MHEVSRGRVVRKDVARATELYKRACELGDGAGCRRHGMIALNARGPAEPQQLGTARAMLERGCGKDDPFACSMFGMLLDNAMGGPMDAKRAQTTFRRPPSCSTSAARLPTSRRAATARRAGSSATSSRWATASPRI